MAWQLMTDDGGAPETDRESTTDSIETEEREERGEGGPFGGLSAKEASLRAVAVRRERAAQRMQESADTQRTFRQRLALALTRLSQTELDQAVRALAQSGRGSDIGTLARLADQAFGRPQDAGEGEESDGMPGTREERAAVWDALVRRTGGAGGDPDADESAELAPQGDGTQDSTETD